ncbi:MAG: VWA domain-containing protein [Deltaproteobacteria bacterium]|nr:VWA domain-containing protein [Deltaproteobacteria bacterium]
MNTIMTLALLASFQPAQSGGLVTASGRVLEVVSSEVDLDVAQDLATATVVQTFRNDGPRREDARYVFPLPHDAAVFAMTMTVGDETVEAKIKRVEEARQEFHEAKARGQSAVLLEEHRANVFTHDVGNIPPGGDIRIELRYAHAVPFEDGVHRLHFPMTVGPRYLNGANGESVAELSKPLPVEVLGERSARGRRMNVRVHLRSGMPILRLSSPTHPIEVDQLGPGSREVSLSEGSVADAKDFVLEYGLSGESVEAGLVTHRDDRGVFGSLVIEPPLRVADDKLPAREIVFVMDASGSMAGEPLEASKRFVSRALEGLRARDTFRLIVFGSSATELSGRPLEPTPGNLATARRFLAELSTQGGTEIELGIRAALDPVLEAGRMRLVVFLTDGFIGDEASVIRTVARTRGDARLFSFGIGPSTNRWLLEELAIEGRGVARILTLGESSASEVERATSELAVRLESPVMTDAWVDFGGCPVTDVSPSTSFDVFAGSPVRIAMRLPEGGCRTKAGAAFEPALVGRMNGRVVRAPIAVRELDRPSSAIPLLWARSQVSDRMRALMKPGRADSAERARIVEEITALGLRYSLTTQWTAFVAHTREAAPVTVEASGGAPSFGGSSAPEPAEWAAFFAVLLAMAIAAKRRRFV